MSGSVQRQLQPWTRGRARRGWELHAQPHAGACCVPQGAHRAGTALPVCWALWAALICLPRSPAPSPAPGVPAPCVTTGCQVLPRVGAGCGAESAQLLPGVRAQHLWGRLSLSQSLGTTVGQRSEAWGGHSCSLGNAIPLHRPPHLGVQPQQAVAPALSVGSQWALCNTGGPAGTAAPAITHLPPAPREHHGICPPTPHTLRSL